MSLKSLRSVYTDLSPYLPSYVHSSLKFYLFPQMCLLWPGCFSNSPSLLWFRMSNSPRVSTLTWDVNPSPRCVSVLIWAIISLKSPGVPFMIWISHISRYGYTAWDVPLFPRCVYCVMMYLHRSKGVFTLTSDGSLIPQVSLQLTWDVSLVYPLWPGIAT